MSLRPEGRYGSPRALVEDLERWLADEPVGARHDPVPARLARWARRHKTPVVGAAALLLAAIVGLTAGTVLLGRANAKTESQRRRAEATYRLARDAVDQFSTQVSENTLLKSPLPGLQPLRKELLQTALRYNQAFVDQRGDDPALKADLALRLPPHGRHHPGYRHKARGSGALRAGAAPCGRAWSPPSLGTPSIGTDSREPSAGSERSRATTSGRQTRRRPPSTDR